MDKKLEVKNLQISFRTQGGILKAVRNISFDLHKGETLAIVGESGSGKSVTSKAIMGILAGNSIVEGGEIIYDGQDLLKISEDDFHKIRGDKIAMIFQDPMSSLNPIMRVGQQLTEAMILKAKTGKRNAKNSFNSKLKHLGACVNAANKDAGVDAAAEVEAKLKKFDAFCVAATKIEREFNEAYGNATTLDMDLDNLLLLLNKGKKVELAAELKRVNKLLGLCVNPYVIEKGEADAHAAKLSTLITAGKNAEQTSATPVLNEVAALVKAALAKDKPDFFTLGYYLQAKPEANFDNVSVAEMNKMTRQFLDADFLNDFIATGAKGVAYAHKQAIANKKACLPDLQAALAYFQSENLQEAKANGYLKDLSGKVSKAIDTLSVKKESVEYVFASALGNAISRYFAGVKKNPIEEKKYLKNKAKYDAIIAKGQTPDWVLTPQVIVDLELQRANICKVLENIIGHYNNCIQQDVYFDATAQMVDIIDFLKDQASKFVVKMNKQIAKAKAIKLLEEVGIPEPAARYNQYPFELSGGMRQRIVIAIALSANPDILIC